MDSMKFVRVPKPEQLVDIKNTHNLWIPQVLHIVHKSYLLVFLLLLKFLFTAIHLDTNYHKKCFILGGQCTF